MRDKTLDEMSRSSSCIDTVYVNPPVSSKTLIDRDKLTRDLTDMFIAYQWRLDNPMPLPDESQKEMYSKYMSDVMFNRKVKALVCAVMVKVDECNG